MYSSDSEKSSAVGTKLFIRRSTAKGRIGVCLASKAHKLITGLFHGARDTSRPKENTRARKSLLIEQATSHNGESGKLRMYS